MNTIPDNMLLDILKKLLPYRQPAMGYIKTIEKKTLLPKERKQLINLLATAIQKVNILEKKKQIQQSLKGLENIQKVEQESNNQDKADVDLLLEEIE